MVIKAVSLSEVSEIAMVPDRECKIPTLMVSPLAAGAVLSVFVVASVVLSAGLEQPTKVTLPIMAATKKDSGIMRCLIIFEAPKQRKI
jgi:hypothetical protein